MKTIILSFSIRNNSLSEFFIELANVLSQTYKVVIITDGESQHPFYISSEIIIYKRPTSGPNSLRVFTFIFKLVKKYKPWVMISNFSYVNIFLIVGYIFQVKHRIAWCHSISSQFISKRPLFDRKEMVYRFATAIFANSESTKCDLISTFGIDRKKIEVFYNAVRDPKIINKKHNSNQLVYVGRLDTVKGVDVLIKSMPVLVKNFPNIYLKIIGDGINMEKYKILANDLSLEAHIEFLGNQSRDIVLEELSKSYLAIVPSRVEAFGYVVIESFSVKTPVVGSETTGISEIIRNGLDGFLVKPGSSEDLTDKIMILLNDKNLRNTFSLNSFHRFETNFELVTIVNKIKSSIDILKE